MWKKTVGWLDGSNFIMTFFFSMICPVIWWIMIAYSFGKSEGKFEGNCKYYDECKNDGKYKYKYEDKDESGKVHPLDWAGLFLAIIIWGYWISQMTMRNY